MSSSNQEAVFSSGEEENLNNNENAQLTDYSTHFETDQEWHDRDSMLEWARGVGRQLNMVLTIKTSWKKRVILACEKFGKSRSKKKKPIPGEIQKDSPRRRQTSTKKSNCKFELDGVMQKNSTWKLRVLCGIHNHNLPQNLEGHAYAGRMTLAEREDVKEWTEAQIAPKKILSMLKEKYPDNLTSLKQIYNLRKDMGKKNSGLSLNSCDSGNEFSVTGMADERVVFEPPENDKPRPPFIHLEFNWGVQNVDDFMFAFITKVTDVAADGHCGYRALAELLGWGQTQWKKVRIELAGEMLRNKELYGAIQPQTTSINELIRNVNFLAENCTAKHWLEMPIVGLVFATRYQVALVLLAWSGAHTCLPMIATEPNSSPPTSVLALALVGSHNHFVPVS
ncbi:hypothetical protein V2J09_010518 [Rumex salicifolius]